MPENRPVLVLGSSGQLAHDLLQLWPQRQPADRLVALSHREIEVSDADSVRRALEAVSPRLVLNTTAYNRVDDAEANPGAAFAVNAAGALNVARACRDLDAVLMHFSTDYVFSGQHERRPHAEADPVDPLSVYAASKAAGEMLVRQTLDEHYIVRSSGLYGVVGSSGKGGNFVETMLRLASQGGQIRVVDDQVLTPTPTWALAGQAISLAATGAYGTYHATCAGECSWFEFAGAIFRQSGLDVRLEPQSSQAAGYPARRPPYSVLSNSKLEELGIYELPDWRAGLAGYLERRSR